MDAFFVTPYRNNSVTIPAKDIERFDSLQMVYTKDEETVRENYSPDLIFCLTAAIREISARSWAIWETVPVKAGDLR